MSTRSPSLVLTAFAGKRRGRSLLDLFALYRSRRALARLDRHALKDLGLSEADAFAEANRAPWDVPAHWVN